MDSLLIYVVRFPKINSTFLFELFLDPHREKRGKSVEGKRIPLLGVALARVRDALGKLSCFQWIGTV
jgi:hypothetical protein